MSIPENVAPPLAQALAKRGYETLTPVQSAVLAPELQASDLIVSAQTGSGKTVAFGLTLGSALLDGRKRFDAPGAPLALIIAPTRELAIQVRRELEWLFAPAGGVVASCVGGMDARDERRALHHGAHIVVGTPGRLVDHIRRGSLVMEHLTAVVLDEADEMLNLGFREELEHILDASPPERRTLMFSATMPRAIEALAKTYQRDAVRVNTIGEARQHVDIEYRALVCARHETENAIFNVLRYYDATNAIVFCATRVAVNKLMSRFENRGFSVVALSGELSQAERTHALQALRDHRAQVCVATDVAARGIDLPDLDLVIHADLPKNTEALLHRSGRTGRAGRKGTSVLIVPYPARRRTDRLLRDAQISAKWGDPPSADDVKQRDDERLLADAVLQGGAEEAERALVAELLSRHSAESIAAAFVRLYRKGQPAPEDLAPTPAWTEDQDTPGARRGAPGPRNGFENSVWIALSVGRVQSAEPRWLIPMLCKAGGLNKRDIGAIRIKHDYTEVELNAAKAEGFFERLGKHGNIEKSIRARPLNGPGEATESRPQSRPPQRPRDDHQGERKPKRNDAPKSQGKPNKGPKGKKQWHPAD